MKNNRGFVVSAVLYPLLILFLALIMGLISMSSTRQSILNNMKLEISDSLFDDATCSCETISNKLDILIKGGGGISGEDVISLSVKNYDSRADFPKTGNARNDIAIVSTMIVNGYFLSDERPAYPAEGSVWIHVKQINTNQTSISTSEINIPIVYVEQYQSGVWKFVEAAIYDGKEWAELSKKDEIEDISIETATEDDIKSGKTAVVNGNKITGSLIIPANSILKGKTIGGVSGTATSDATAVASDIALGKTAYVNGDKITGTKSDSMYFKIEKDDKEVYLNGLIVHVGTCDNAGSSATCAYWKNASGVEETIILKTDTETVYTQIDSIWQVSMNTVAVLWHYDQTVKDTDNEQNVRTYYQIVTLYVKSGHLAKKDTQTLSYSPDSTDADGNTKQTYYFYTSMYNKDTSTTSDSRTVEFNFFEQPFSDDVNNTMKYYYFVENYSRMYLDFSNDSKSFDENGFCIISVGINRYSGDLSVDSSKPCKTNKYMMQEATMTSKDIYLALGKNYGGFYGREYDEPISNFGYMKITYTNTDQMNISSVTYYDYPGFNGPKSFTVTTSNVKTAPATLVRDLGFSFSSDITYAMNASFDYNNNNINTTLKSANVNSEFYFSNGTKLYENSQSFDIKGVVPSDVTVRSAAQRGYYSGESQKFYVIMPCSIGKLYLIFGVHSKDYAEGIGLTLSLESATYRAKEDGTKVSSEPLSMFSDQNIVFYR